MKKYYVNGKQISETEAILIDMENKRLQQSKNIADWAGIQFIIQRQETMTEQEYREALHEINVRAENERRILARAFAFEHSPVLVGDYISDQCDTIRVERWEIVNRTHEYNSLPCLVYRGMTCKKNGTPRKNPKKCSIYQCNLLRVNGEPVKNHGYGEQKKHQENEEGHWRNGQASWHTDRQRPAAVPQRTTKQVTIYQ